MRIPRLAATLAFAVLICGAGASAPARAGELALFPYFFKCAPGWTAQQAGPIDGLTWCAGTRFVDGDAFVGEVRLFAFNFCPQPDWVKAEGQVLPISRYSAQFSVMGARFGGDGNVAFALPNIPGAPAGMTWCIALNGSFPRR